MGVPPTPQPMAYFFRARESCRRHMILVLPLIWISFTHPATASDLDLSLKQAIEIALSQEGSAEVQMAQESIREVQARSQQSRAELLPHLGASVGFQNQTRNLEALGLQPSPLFRPPTRVGPFTTFDARTNLTQTIFHLGSIRRFQASRIGVRVAQTEKENIEERTAAQVARFYLEALRNRARLDAARANLELATALADLAENQKEAGIGTGIEVTRAQVQVSNEQQRLLGAEQQHRQSLLRLLKLIGIRLDANLTLTDNLTHTPVQVADMQEALAIALRSRSDLQAHQKREEQADLDYRAARSDRIPSLSGFAGYGTIGSGIDSAIPTWNLGISLELPVFDGGRVDARRAEALSRLRREGIEGHRTYAAKSNWKFGWPLLASTWPGSRSPLPRRDCNWPSRNWSKPVVAIRLASPVALRSPMRRLVWSVPGKTRSPPCSAITWSGSTWVRPWGPFGV